MQAKRATLIGLAGKSLQAVLWAALVAFIVLLAVPRFTDYDVLIVRGGSMEPSIRAGGVELVDRGQTKLREGDIAAFRELGTGVVTHRVVGFEGDRMITRGDANETDDATHRRPEDVIGKVVFDLPYLGRLLYVLQQPVAFLVLLSLTGGVLIWSEVKVIAREVQLLRKPNSHPEEGVGDA